MFCPSCGAEYAIELKYCNRCGANLSSSLIPQSPPVIVNLTKPTLIVALTMTIVTLGGFLAVVIGTVNLAIVLNAKDPLIAIIVFGMLTILTIDIFLARLLTRLVNSALSPSQHQPNQPISINTSAPQVPPNPARLQAASVTENTTRFFEPYGTRAEPVDRTTSHKLDS